MGPHTWIILRIQIQPQHPMPVTHHGIIRRDKEERPCAFIVRDGQVCSVIWAGLAPTPSTLQTWHRLAIIEKLHERVHYSNKVGCRGLIWEGCTVGKTWIWASSQEAISLIKFGASAAENIQRVRSTWEIVKGQTSCFQDAVQPGRKLIDTPCIWPLCWR